jgi:hypothetical protein
MGFGPLRFVLSEIVGGLCISFVFVSVRGIIGKEFQKTMFMIQGYKSLCKSEF